jgi:hypothetical protein
MLSVPAPGFRPALKGTGPNVPEQSGPKTGACPLKASIPRIVTITSIGGKISVPHRLTALGRGAASRFNERPRPDA